MDKSLRNTLRATITLSRRLLEDAIADLLEGQFGILRNGTIQDASRMTHLATEDLRFREEIIAHLRHIQATMVGDGAISRAAVEQLIREVGFTHLNRLCAYKILEDRKLIREVLGRGLNSTGFKFYLADHPADEELWSGGRQDLAYRHFLEWLGATLSQEIGVLFSPHDPANRLFPPHRVLEQLLALLNSADLAEVWDDDETIGWVYQYYTPKELRDKARKESSAPRNSYELAFRNQFYTPDYVVRFLVDNTLGRIWYEMQQGQTALVDKCRYLVRHTESIPNREKIDPRQLRILDPACGSGHFLLYAFDLLEAIYQEAWSDPDLGPTLWKDLGWNSSGADALSASQSEESLAVLRRALPGLILRDNLHGIDIDLRATQIASLALWLRAQRAFKEAGVAFQARPPITRTNIVCAEPMPGELDFLDEFVADLRPRVLGQVARVVFQRMKLAGEAGSLLKIEDEMRSTLAEAKRQWKSAPKEEQLSLWPGERRPKPEQLSLFDVADITDEAFWDEAEGRLLDALEEYAERASNGNGRSYSRRLFVDDTEQGFAFVDLCRKHFDVVLMNPPFGEDSKPSKSYIEGAYPRTKHDLYAAFVERGLGWLRPGGLLGAITSRTGFFLSSFQKWREEILLE